MVSTLNIMNYDTLILIALCLSIDFLKFGRFNLYGLSIASHWLSTCRILNATDKTVLIHSDMKVSHLRDGVRLLIGERFMREVWVSQRQY